MHMAQQYSVERGETKLGRHEWLPASEPKSSSSGGKSASFCLGWSLDKRPSGIVFSSRTNGEADLAKGADVDRATNGETERRKAGDRTGRLGRVEGVGMEQRNSQLKSDCCFTFTLRQASQLFSTLAVQGVIAAWTCRVRMERRATPR